jgi:hypothetical protein
MRTSTAFKAVAIVGFKDSQRGVKHLAPGHDNDIKPGCDLVTTKNLTYESFSAVPLNGTAELFRCGNAEASNGAMVRQNKDRRVSSLDTGAALIDFLKFGAPADVFMRPEPGQMALFAADGQAFAPFRPPPFKHQPTVFRAHPHQKAVRLRAVAVIWLERTLTFHLFSPDANRQC